MRHSVSLTALPERVMNVVMMATVLAESQSALTAAAHSVIPTIMPGVVEALNVWRQRVSPLRAALMVSKTKRRATPIVAGFVHPAYLGKPVYRHRIVRANFVCRGSVQRSRPVTIKSPMEMKPTLTVVDRIVTHVPMGPAASKHRIV